ncbi:MAG: glycoside hydrolase family 99-like domain-containing protein [Lachnospiraceae bacterium]|nr:glycoside hydrolase family 99-like domain-containing protein [Lachnospiraceae bacterium]
MRTIAFYLPQYHEIPENNEWWGHGFTEWVNVKKAKPLFEGHQQPRVPLNKNYYDLSDVNVMRWQVGLAKKYGVYGFCFYHYWFNGKKLLEKPVDNYLAAKDIDFPFCICWANEHWTNKWATEDDKVLIEQKYGGKEQWKDHFDYLLPFLKDERYIYQDGKPLFIIYRPELITKRNEMMEYWDTLAKENGLPGICFAFQHPGVLYNYPDVDVSKFDYCIEYQPATAWMKMDKSATSHKELRKVKLFLEKNFKFSSIPKQLRKSENHMRFEDYDKVWETVFEGIDLFPRCIPCAPVDWDNTPRWGERGRVFTNRTTEKFGRYFDRLIKLVKKKYPTDMIFVFAWNEWAEGGYIEPDELNGYGNLEAIRDALKANGDFVEAQQ